MPETSMNENDRLVSRQNDVRFPGKSLDIDTIAKSSGKKGLAKRNFRFVSLFLIRDMTSDLFSRLQISMARVNWEIQPS